MKLVRRTKLHFREANSDKIYEVDLCETGGKYLVNFRYGRRGTDLKEGTKTVETVDLTQAEKIFQKLVGEKTKKGYHIVGEQTETADEPKKEFVKSVDDAKRNGKILEKLRDAKAKSDPNIERTIWRAGELKITEAADDLVKFIGTAKELRDYCVAWSLGFCGDAENVSDLKKLTNHSADYVRCIAREAIYKIGDEAQRENLKNNALGKLSANLQNFIENKDAENLVNALLDELSFLKGKSFDAPIRLYESRDETARFVLLGVLREFPFVADLFKPVRQIFKVAEYRRDAEVFGVLAKRFETEKAGFWSSGWGNWIYLQKEDGNYEYIQDSKKELAKPDSRLAFSNKTKDYLRRRTWRTLRRLGEDNNAAEYTSLAVGALLQYSDDDAHEPKKSEFYDYLDENGNWNWNNRRLIEIYWDKFSPYLLFNHILYENSPRYELKIGSKGFRLKAGHQPDEDAPNVREEAFPKLWEASPVSLVYLLSESNCQPIHEFAVKALRSCPQFVEALDVDTVLMLLSRPYKSTAKFAFELAQKLYDVANPNIELAVAVAVSDDETSRAEAFKWIKAKPEIFAKDVSVLLRFFNSKHADTREFAANLMQTAFYEDAEAQNVIASLISELVAFDDAEKAADLSAALLQSFPDKLRTLNFETIENLLSHPLVEIQQFGGQILLNHEMRAENLPDDLINSLIDSEFEQIRSIGIKLFGKLPDENLVRRNAVFASLLAHELVDVFETTRPLALRVAARNDGFTNNLSNSIFIRLLQAEENAEIHLRLLSFLKELPDWTKCADFETAKMLVNSDFAEANEAGGLILQDRSEDWKDEFSVEEIVEFSNHEVLAIRQTSWTIAEKTVENLREEVSYLIRALDAKWEDSRGFWRGFFGQNFTRRELTPEILIAIADSVKDETQKFGRDLLLEYFEAENGVEYLLKLSEHPSAAMQFFATNYLENYAADSPEKLEKLTPYFVRVLSLVNRSRAAKNRVLIFLEKEALKDEKSAGIASEILARQSATLAIGDKAKMIETMLKIRRQFPAIRLPITIKSTEVRQNAV